MASGVNATPAALLVDPCNNFTFAPWTIAGATSIAAALNGNGFSFPASQSNTARYDIPTPSQTDTITIGFNIRFPTLPPGLTAFLSYRSDAGATSHDTVQVDSTGQMRIARSSPSQTLGLPSAANTILVNTWYYLEATIKLSDTAGYGQVRVNGTPVITTLTTEDTKSGGTKTVLDQIAFFGMPSSGTYLVDDIYVRNDATFGP
jgi:hypothetical protein